MPVAAAENEKELARRAAQRAPTASVRAEPDRAPDTRDARGPKFSQREIVITADILRVLGRWL